MSYTATVLRVMIASPSDVPEARDAVERAIYKWNGIHAQSKGVILQPWRWESSAVPVLGAHPQKIINSQGVDDSDIVFALFGGRLGSATPDAISGTVEEIDRAVAQGKPVHLHFSTAPLPHDVDTAQLEALRAFKKDMRDRGLFGEFDNPEQLNEQVWKAIEHDLAALLGDTRPATHTAPDGVDFLVQPGQEREISGATPKGAPKYRTRRWLDVTNTGTRDAENVTFKAIHDGYMILSSSREPTTIHKDQTRRLNVQYAASGSDGAVLRIQWTENGEDKQRDFAVG